MSGSSWDISSFNFDEITNILLYGTSPTQTINFTDATISIYYDGESGYNQTYPYSVLAEVDTGSEVLRSAGAVADEKTPDGTITRRIKSYTFTGSETWKQYSTSNKWFTGAITDALYGTIINYQTDKFVAISPRGGSETAQNGEIFAQYSTSIYKRFYVCLDSATSASDVQTATQGMTLYYELATPTTEQGTDFNPAYAVDAGGTESWLQDQSTGVPQGHETEYKEFTT